LDDHTYSDYLPLHSADGMALQAKPEPAVSATTLPLVRGASQPAPAAAVREPAVAARAGVVPPRRRILLYGLNFAPEQTGIGKYTGEMAQWLSNAGHDVRVVTTPPYYPDWSIGHGYSGWRYSRETWNGVRVDRAPLWVPKQPGGKKRLLHLASFAAFSMPLLMRSYLWRPHLVWTVAPTLACAPGAALFARMSGAVSWLHVQDFEVDAAFQMGMLRGEKVRAGAWSTERALMGAFDRVSSISNRMVTRLQEKGVASDRAVYFPNWVDTDAIKPKFTLNAYRKMLGIPENAFVALYSGTMAAKQGLEVLSEAAHLLGQQKNIHFLFCGQGVGREVLRSACASLPRVHWLPLQPVSELAELLNIADVHLLPQQRVSADLMMPSKLTGMLASGRPVIATADPGTELASWVDGCGYLVTPGDGAALAHAIVRMSQDPLQCLKMGALARQRALQHLSRDAVLRGFNSELEGALASRPQ
jgi:colanic acid biosynthesis glycosyl transferase WcaI